MHVRLADLWKSPGFLLTSLNLLENSLQLSHSEWLKSISGVSLFPVPFPEQTAEFANFGLNMWIHETPGKFPKYFSLFSGKRPI